MKQQRCASSLLPSKLCRILLLALGLKLTVLGFMLCEPLTPKTGAGIALAANAAPNAAVGAPPTTPVTPFGGSPAQSIGSGGLPDVGIQRPTPGKGVDSVTPAAVPGIAVQPPAAPGSTSPTPSDGTPRSLPSINRNTGTGAGSVANPAGAGTSGTPTANGASASGAAPDIARETLSRKQEELTRKEQELRALEADISAKLERMQILENRLQMMMKDAEDTRDAKFRQLVGVLTNMKSKQAAAMLETLDQRVAVKLLAGMQGRAAGEILSNVKPEIAAHLTEALARMQLPLE